MILETHTTERDAREAALHLSTEGVEASVGAAHGVFTLSVRSGDVALAVALLELRRLRQVPSAPTPQGRPGRWAALAVCSSLALAGASAWLVGAGVRGPDGVELVELDSDRRADGFNQRDTEGRLRIAHTDVDRDGRLDRAVVVGRDGRVATTWYDDDGDGIYDRVRHVDPDGRTVTLADMDHDGFPEQRLDRTSGRRDVLAWE